MATVLTIALSVVAITASALSIMFSVLTHRRLRRARELSEQPSPVISFPGTLTPEAEAKLSASLAEGIERLRGDGRLPW